LDQRVKTSNAKRGIADVAAKHASHRPTGHRIDRRRDRLNPLGEID
jgi:hypothetical protein